MVCVMILYYTLREDYWRSFRHRHTWTEREKLRLLKMVLNLNFFPQYFQFQEKSSKRSTAITGDSMNIVFWQMLCFLLCRGLILHSKRIFVGWFRHIWAGRDKLRLLKTVFWLQLCNLCHFQENYNKYSTAKTVRVFGNYFFLPCCITLNERISVVYINISCKHKCL